MLGFGDETNLSMTVVSSCLARGIPELVVVVVVCVVRAGWRHHSMLYSLAFAGLAVGGSLISLKFPAPFFLD